MFALTLGGLKDSMKELANFNRGDMGFLYHLPMTCFDGCDSNNRWISFKIFEIPLLFCINLLLLRTIYLMISWLFKSYGYI